MGCCVERTEGTNTELFSPLPETTNDRSKGTADSKKSGVDKRGKKWEEYEDFMLVQSLCDQIPTKFNQDLMKVFRDMKTRFDWKKAEKKVPFRTAEQCSYRFNRLK